MLAPSHIILLGLLILLALVIFGPKRLPELGQGVGRAIQEFKRASSQAVNDVNQTSSDLQKSVSLNPAAAPDGIPVVSPKGNPVVVGANGVEPLTSPAGDPGPADQGRPN